MKKYFKNNIFNLFIITLLLISATGCEIFMGENDDDYVNILKTGELDLSQFDDSDGIPEMNSGFVAGDNIYISLQRVNRNSHFSPDNTSQIVSFDKSTLVHNGTINMALRNPYNIDYHNGYVYAACTGNWKDQHFGLEKINISTNTSESIIYNSSIVSDVEIVSDTRGYFIEYLGWGNTAIRSFNPSTGIVDEGNVAEIGDSNDWNLTDLNCDENKNLWVADASMNNNGIYVIRTSDNTITDGPISTNLYPQKIAFTNNIAVVTAAAADYTSGAYSIIPLESPRTAKNNLYPTISDISVSTYGDYFYIIKRNDADVITKFSYNARLKAIWQYSTMDNNDLIEKISSSNPHGLIFINKNKAILLRYRSSRAWIVNPSIEEQEINLE